MKVCVYLDHREQDLRCRGAEGHQCEIGHSLVPYSHCSYSSFTVGFSDGHLLLLHRYTFGAGVNRAQSELSDAVTWKPDLLSLYNN